VPLIGPGSRDLTAHGLVLLRPEHFAIAEAPDGPAQDAGWEVISRRFSGSEILLEVRAADGQRLWVEAGSRVRHLGLGDHVRVALREIETVAFGRRAPVSPETATNVSGTDTRTRSPLAR
jgi:hypothetical protein